MLKDYTPSEKRKIIKLTIALVFFLIIGYLCFYYAATQSYAAYKERTGRTPLRTENGTFVSKTYHTDGDYTSMDFVTEDRNVYHVNNYVCPLFTKGRVTFNTKGTADLSDDEIVYIVTYTSAQK